MRDYVYPSLLSPPSGRAFSDQFAFQPITGSTTAQLSYTSSTPSQLSSKPIHVIVYALDFSKAFDSFQQSAVLDKYSRMKIPDSIYNWIEAFFRDHSHCTRFGNEVSGFRKMLVSIIQGSGIGPASYVVTASDLHPVTAGNSMCKYADNTYLAVPAANSHVQQNLHLEITSKCKFDRITPTLRSLHWLKIKQCIQYKIISLTYTALQKGQPNYLRRLLIVKHGPTGSGDIITLSRPATSRLKISDCSFHLKAPAIWNSLPAHLRQPTSPAPSNGLGLLALSRQQFLAQLKTHLFHQSFPPGSQ